jgi:hypothetical protein
MSTFDNHAYKYVLSKPGFTDVYIRKMLGVWEMRMYLGFGGRERREAIDSELFPEEKILAEIQEYGREID